MDTAKNELFETFPFFKLTPDLVCIANKEGFFEQVNHAVIEKLEYTEAELFAKPISTFIHPDDKELTSSERKKLINGNPLVNFQNRYITKSEKIIWLDWTSIYFPDQQRVFAIAKDVTARKEIEMEIEEDYRRYKNLATNFKSRIEKDRKTFAVELHEELAQLASVVKMDVDWINTQMPEMSDLLKKRFDHVAAVSTMLIDRIRRISFSISPYMLGDLGLNETLKWLCKEFTVLNKISCLFVNNSDELTIPYETKLDLFRICQESLNNIMQHAQASSVKISLEKKDKKLCLSIIDDGQGFDVQQQNKISGLTTIRDLTNSINGQLSIQSEIGNCTLISVTITI